MNEDFILIKGSQEGPTSVILTGVHGNERSGIEAFSTLLPDLKIDRGQVWFGYGNPRAIEANTRNSETNLNRLFKSDESLTAEQKASYEYSRAKVIQKYLDKSSALLDIHASFTPESEPFIICESNAKGIVEFLPANIVVSGFDAIQPGGTDYYMNKNGKIGICLECGYLGIPETKLVAEEGIMNFLKARGHINGQPKVRQQTFIQMFDLYYTKTAPFKLAKEFKDFEKLTAGQVIGTDGEEKIYVTKESVIVFPTDCSKAGEEAFLLGEEKKSLA